MFQTIQKQIGQVFDKLKRKGALSLADVDSALAELRTALLEADVALSVVEDLLEATRARAVGDEVMRSLSPAQQTLKVLYSEMTKALGGTQQSMPLSGAPPMVILLVGLQGSGKTTTAGKLAWKLCEKENKHVLVASTDTTRPAAFEQLSQLVQSTPAKMLPRTPGEPPHATAQRAQQTALMEGFEVVILDTAGRQTTAQTEMESLREIRDLLEPFQTLLVADSMSGQSAAQSALAFHEEVGLTGIILTRLDGDQRGGAALSVHGLTQCPVYAAGVGERIEDLEDFTPERIASRILGLGDQAALFAQLQTQQSEEEQEALKEKLHKGQFDLNDLATQLKQMRKMGGISKILDLLPKMQAQQRKALEQQPPDEGLVGRQLAAIDSMTSLERAKPELLKASRKLRVARGSGVDVPTINRMLKQHKHTQKMMKRMSRKGMQGQDFLPKKGMPGF